MSTVYFYHGSKVGGITMLEPRLYKQVSDRPVVFATADPNYALAMIHASGAELAVCYAADAAGKRAMYVDELRANVLQELEQPGYLYEFSSEGFEPSPENLEGEYVSYTPVPVMKETFVSNVRQALETAGVHMVDYDHVLDSMKSRGQDLGAPLQKHAEDRFDH